MTEPSADAASRKGSAASPPWKFGRRPWVMSLVSMTLGVGLLWLGIPRTIAAWYSLGAEPALDKLQDGVAPLDEELATGAAALFDAIGWTLSARRLTDLALLELAQAERLSNPDPLRAEVLAVAEEHLTTGLWANPANGYAWFRLAIIRDQRGADGREIAIALAYSIDMAPNVRRLRIPRIELGLRYWEAMTEEELFSMRSQIRAVWTGGTERERRALLAAAKRSRQETMIGWALAEDPDAVSEYERLRGGPSP